MTFGAAHLYASSRTLYGLACHSKAPSIFRYCTKRGVPVTAVCASASVSLLAYMNAGSYTTSQTFQYLSSCTSVTGVVVWLSILVSYCRFYAGTKLQGHDRTTFPYRARCQPWASYAAIVVLLLVVAFVRCCSLAARDARSHIEYARAAFSLSYAGR